MVRYHVSTHYTTANMNPSIFISSETTRRYPVISLEVIERFFGALSSIPNCSKESAIFIAFRDTYKDSHLIRQLGDWEDEAIAEIECLLKPDDLPQQSGGGSKLLESLAKFLSGLDIDNTLLLMCHGDFHKAHHLYHEVDARFTRSLIKSWVTLYMELARANYETALYAQGGTLGSESSTAGKHVTDPKTAKEAKKMGLSVVSDEDRDFFTI